MSAKMSAKEKKTSTASESLQEEIARLKKKLEDAETKLTNNEPHPSGDASRSGWDHWHGEVTRISQQLHDAVELLKLENQQASQQAPSTDAKILEKLNAMSIAQQENNKRVEELSQSVKQGKPITPSTASRNSGEDYKQLLHILNLDAVNVVEQPTEIKHKLNSFQFDWTSSQGPELAENKGYDPVKKYIEQVLAKLGDENADAHVVVVGDGQRLNNRLLFKKHLHTLRLKNPSKHRGRVVRFVQTVKGRTDLVVLKEDVRGTIGCGHLACLVEVKPPSEMKNSQSGCERDAVVQLIGVSATNDYASPPVVLTNLVRTHKVYYLTCVAEEPLKFQINCVQFSNLGDAIQCAMGVSRCPNLQLFATSTTPMVSSDSGNSSESEDHGVPQPVPWESLGNYDPVDA